jgi:hypothetical protein
VGEILTESFCEKNYMSDSLLREILEVEKSLREKCIQKNSKITFAIAIIKTFNKNEIFVDSQYLATFFDILHSSLQKNLFFEMPNNSVNSQKKLLEKFGYKMGLTYQETNKVLQNMVSDTKLSSGLSPIVKLSVFVCLYLEEFKLLSRHRSCSIVSAYFHISRNTILKHIKAVKA